MAGPLHYFQFAQKDWLSTGSVRRLSLAGKGLLIDLMAFQWEDGCLPNDPAVLCRIVGADRKEFDRAWKEIRAMFEAEESCCLVYRELAIQREDVIQKVASRAECGKRGGRPKKTESKAEEKLLVLESKANGKQNETKPKANTESDTDKPLVSTKPAPEAPAEDKKGRAENHAYDPVLRVLSQVNQALGWKPPLDADVKRGLKPESHLSSLIAQFGEDGAVELFTLAHKEWPEDRRPTWPAVFGQRNQLFERLKGIKAETKDPEAMRAETLARVRAMDGGR